MNLSTKRLGEIDLREQKLFRFPEGLLGFPQAQRFVVLNYADDSPFKWLQSVDDPHLAFIIIDPLLFRPDYHVALTEALRRELGVTESSDLVLAVVVTVREAPEDISANLQGPLLFNHRTLLGKQIVLGDSLYTTRHYLLREMRELVNV